MKRHLLFKSLLLLCALVVGSTSVWADSTAEFSFSNFSGQGKSGSGGNLTGATEGSITVTGTGYGNTSYLQVYSNNYLTITPNNGAIITKIELTGTSSTYIRSWSASDASSVTVSGSKATWSGSSTSAITLTNTGTAQARITSIVVTYTGGTVTPVTGVTVDPTSWEMIIGQTKALTATVAPASATNKNVSWSSNDETVATVNSSGVVTAVSLGTAKITVTTDDGSKTAECAVTVTPWSINLAAPIVISDWSDVSSGYYKSDTYLNIDGTTFKLFQCCRQTTLQIKASEGVLTSPTIKSSNGFSVIIETAAGSHASGVLTLQIGDETGVTVTGANKTVMATTSSSEASFTIKNLSSNVMKLGKITIVPNQYNTTVQSYGWATYIAPAPVEFAANTAYVVTDASVASGLTLAAVTQVPAGTPLLLKGEGAKTVTVIASASDPATNLLSVCNGTIDDGKYAYVLAKNGTGACFKQWTGPAATLNGRVVLLLDKAAAARVIFELDDDATGIKQVETSKQNAEGFYNLAGQRVAQPTKGLYIVNGKKVIK